MNDFTLMIIIQIYTIYAYHNTFFISKIEANISSTIKNIRIIGKTEDKFLNINNTKIIIISDNKKIDKFFPNTFEIKNINKSHFFQISLNFNLSLLCNNSLIKVENEDDTLFRKDESFTINQNIESNYFFKIVNTKDNNELLLKYFANVIDDEKSRVFNPKNKNILNDKNFDFTWIKDLRKMSEEEEEEEEEKEKEREDEKKNEINNGNSSKDEKTNTSSDGGGPNVAIVLVVAIVAVVIMVLCLRLDVYEENSSSDKYK